MRVRQFKLTPASSPRTAAAPAAARARGAVFAVACAAAVAIIGAAVTAHANPRVKARIERKMKEAMENFDLFAFDDAKKQLNEAIVMAKKAGLENDPLMAQVHIRLGIVYFSGIKDVESAKLSFINAVSIDPAAEIDPSYKTGEMEQLLEDARIEIAGGGGDTGGGGEDCSGVQAIQHTLVDTAESGVERVIEAQVGESLGAARVSLFYRPRGVELFTEVKMQNIGGCRYTGVIPGEQITNDFMHYYIAAFDAEGKTIASKGSEGSPNIIDIEGIPGLGGGGRKRGGEISEQAPGVSKPPKLFLSIALGSGGGYVTGETEQENTAVGCCFAPALFHLFPEVGYYLNPKISLSFAFRMGFPIGANIEGHATAAPSGVLRLRYGLSEAGQGLQVSGSLGGGLIRHTVKLADGQAGMDTDTTVSGPMLLGAGVGYIYKLSGPLSFAAELNALAGIPIIGELGACENPDDVGCIQPAFAVQFDANVGVMFAF